MENFGCLKTDGHVCCNNTLTRNAVGAKVITGAGVSANVITKTTMALSGDNGGGGKVHGVDVGQRWNFSSELFLTLAVGDNAPLLTASPAGSAGTDVNFFGTARPTQGKIEAGPFDNVSSATSRFRIWPPGGRHIQEGEGARLNTS